MKRKKTKADKVLSEAWVRGYQAGVAFVAWSYGRQAIAAMTRKRPKAIVRDGRPACPWCAYEVASGKAKRLECANCGWREAKSCK